MATVTKKPPAGTPTPPRRGLDVKPDDPWILRACDAVYRFLASLKLAVISLSLLATTLAVATALESRLGSGFAQDYIYRSKGFAVLLTFLGLNILCAALIRFPWTKRQTGFVITHAGLLIVLVGTFITFKMADEGQLAILEGGKGSELVRRDRPVIRVQKLDAESGEPTNEYVFPFYGGPFAWSEGSESRVTQPGDPFQLVVRRYLPSSSPPIPVHEPAPSGDGVPMLKVALLAKPPGAKEAQDILGGRNGDGGWLAMSGMMLRIGRVEQDVGPALLSFQFVSGPHADEKLDDFLHPPKNPLTEKVARFHYEDNSGKTRVFTWTIDQSDTRPFTLPDSDLTVTFIPKEKKDPHGDGLDHGDPHGAMTDDDEGPLQAVRFKVRKGDGPEVVHYGWAAMPNVPSVLPNREAPETSRELVRIGYFHPPGISRETMRGRFGVIEVMGTPDRSLYYRAFGRDGLRGIGPVKLGQTVAAFGGDKMPMTLSFRVDEFWLSGRTRHVCEPIELPVGKLENAVPACEVTMTVGGQAEKFWARSSTDYDARFQDVRFPSGRYRVAYDFERKSVGFEMTLTDFDIGVDPGTPSPSSFTSEVLLNDPEKGIKDEPKTITMNEPLTHRGWTFYQTNYIPQTDEEGRSTGQYLSIFQVHYDPAWQVVYLGCLTVVLGTFVQFYMRAGVFSDGGKRERARAEARARKAAARAGQPLPPESTPPAEDPDAADVEETL
jgi:hypothetical protein